MPPPQSSHLNFLSALSVVAPYQGTDTEEVATDCLTYRMKATELM